MTIFIHRGKKVDIPNKFYKVRWEEHSLLRFMNTPTLFPQITQNRCSTHVLQLLRPIQIIN